MYISVSRQGDEETRQLSTDDDQVQSFCSIDGQELAGAMLSLAAIFTFQVCINFYRNCLSVSILKLICGSNRTLDR